MNDRVGVVAVLGLLASLVLTRPAHAGGTWSDNISYRRSSGTSLKVTEPEGFKVTVTTPQGDQTGTVPELFQLPDEDAFVKVTVTATSGATWSKKIEIRAQQQAELAVAFKAEDSKPGGGASRSFVGNFKNLGAGCGKAWSVPIRADFLRSSDGVSAGKVIANPGKTMEVEITTGKYDVRVYVAAGNDWKFLFTTPHEVTKDGWLLGFGCKQGSTKPVLISAD